MAQLGPNESREGPEASGFTRSHANLTARGNKSFFGPLNSLAEAGIEPESSRRLISDRSQLVSSSSNVETRPSHSSPDRRCVDPGSTSRLVHPRSTRIQCPCKANGGRTAVNYPLYTVRALNPAYFNDSPTHSATPSLSLFVFLFPCTFFPF